MPYEVYVGTKQGIEDRMNGAFVMGPFRNSGLPIGGLTLIFATPAATVTFTGSAGEVRTLDQIIADIVAQAPTLAVSKRRADNAAPARSVTPAGGRPDPEYNIVVGLVSGITIDKDGTANPLLVLPVAADTVVRPGVAPTKLLGFSQGSTPAHYAIVIDLSP